MYHLFSIQARFGQGNIDTLILKVINSCR